MTSRRVLLSPLLLTACTIIAPTPGLPEGESSASGGEDGESAESQNDGSGSSPSTGDESDGPTTNASETDDPTDDTGGQDDSGESGDTDGPPADPAYEPNKFVTADADGSGDGSEGNPWTLQQAVAEAVAGDVVQIGPGVYTGEGGEAGTDAAFAIAHAGTPDQPIIFFAEHPAAVTDDASLRSKLRNLNHTELAGAATLATNSYVIVDGLWFDYADHALPSGRGVVYNPFETSHMKLRRLRFDRTNLGPVDDGDNFNCIHAHRNEGLEITDSRFVGGYDATGAHNEATITLYGTIDVLIEHNNFENVTAGVYFKGSAGEGPDGTQLGNAGVVRLNRFTSCKHCLFMAMNEDPLVSEAYQNLFYYDLDVATPNQAYEFDNAVPPEQRNTHVYANTIVVASNYDEGGITSQNSNVLTDNVVRDNIVVALQPTNQVLINFWEIASLSAFTEFDYNWYYNAGQPPLFAVGGELQEGLAAWQAASGRDVNAHAGDPMFEDADAHDYRLAEDSPARTASSTGGPVGCYITGDEVIGIRNAPPY